MVKLQMEKQSGHGTCSDTGSAAPFQCAGLALVTAVFFPGGGNKTDDAGELFLQTWVNVCFSQPFLVTA